MHADQMLEIRHEHDFDGVNHEHERRTLRVIGLTGVMMCAEIVAGALTGSMALWADGCHMGTHAFALGITYFSYVMARRYAGSAHFGFGTGKFGVFSGYNSALFLGGTALFLIVESFGRLLHPVPIAFNEAIGVAAAGLLINAVSVFLLQGSGNGHDHAHGQDHGHDQGHYDHNLRAAYLHVIADALTSILAIVALVSGKYLGWTFLDPVMGIAGGLLIARWAWGLLRSSAFILLDGNSDMALRAAVVQAIESDGDSRVGDLHLWPLNSNDLAGAIAVASGERRSPSEYRARLSGWVKIKHITIEVHWPGHGAG